MKSQTCKICQKEKPFEDFPKHRSFKTRLDNRCKECIRNQTKVRNELKKKYGYLKGDFCSCCGKKPLNKTLVLDHDHMTGEFRGWICESCNHGIGQLGDNIEGVLKAVRYLEK